MPPAPLARLLDPDAVAAIEGPRALLRIEVPASFLAAGATIELTAPARLACARCEGGGCDGCARSGALRAPEEAPARTLRATLPGGAAGPLAMRIAEPFGSGSAIRLLLVEVRTGAGPSAGVRRVEVAPAEGAPRPRPLPWPAIAVAVLAAASILAALLHR